MHNTWITLGKVAQIFGYYGDINSKLQRCGRFGGITDIPLFITESKTRLKNNSRIVLALLNLKKKNKGIINESHIESLETAIYDLIEAEENSNDGISELYSQNDYQIICICLGKKYTKEYKIIYNDKFKSMTILGQNELTDIFYTKHNPEQEFRKIAVKSWILKDLNPYSADNATDSNHAVYIKRSIRDSISKNENNVAIYGGRRIGKTSICKDIELEYNRSNSSHCIYLAVNVYKFVPKNKEIYRKGLQVAESILQRLGKKIVLSNFGEFNDYILEIYKREYKDKRLLIILDEFDGYIVQSNTECDFFNEENSFDLVDSIRHLHAEEPKIKFIISGFITLWSHLVDQGSKSSVAKGSNPFKGLAEQQPIYDLNRDEAIKLINTLSTRLSLEFENDGLIEHILEYTGHHPAFIQGFCNRLVDSISDKITRDYRTITLNDIEDIFVPKEFNNDNSPTYFWMLNDIIQMNFRYILDGKSYLNIANALMTHLVFLLNPNSEDTTYVSAENLFDQFNVVISEKGQQLTRGEFQDTIKVLRLNQVIQTDDQDKQITFYYKFWIPYVWYLVEVNSNYTDEIIINAANDIREWRNSVE